MGNERTVVVLVGHGAPPKGFPEEKVAEYLRLERRLRAGDRSVEATLEELERELREWPRTKENDPYWFHVTELARLLQEMGGYMKVIAAFNEFCSPSVEEAIEEAANLRPETVIVVPTMMIRGGEHSEIEIREIVERAKLRHKDVRIVYAWPFDTSELARFLLRHLSSHQNA